jgi:D-aspartate ligase
MKDNIPGVVIIDGHVQGLALTRSFGEKGIPVYIIDRNNYGIARYSKYCKGYFKSPDYLADNFVDFLLELSRKENLNNWILLPCDDHIVYSISRRKKELEKVYKVITVDYAILQNIINKQNLFNIAAGCNLPVIRTCYTRSCEIKYEDIQDFRFPVLVKGIEGQTFYKKTNHKAYKALNFQSTRQIINKLCEKVDPSDIMIQEMIPLNGVNKVVSFTAFCIQGEIKSYWMGQKIREHPINFGTATFSQSVFNQIVLDQSVPLIKALNYEGVCEIEYLLDPRDNKYYLIEINPRTWLWVGLAKECGIDYAQMIYNYMNNIGQSFPQEYKCNVYWKNEVTDLLFAVSDMFKGKLATSDFLKYLFKRKTKALYQKGDYLPLGAFLLLLPYIFIKRR